MTEISVPTTRSAADLQRSALDHLALHFTQMETMRTHGLPVIARGDGCYLWDAEGRRYLDSLGGILSVQIGYGFGDEMAEAAAAQLRELPFYTNWAHAHPRAIELAEELVELAPGDIARVLFVSGGSEAVEGAWKLARQHFWERGEHRWRAIARRSAYHGVTMGALSLTGLPQFQEPFQPILEGGLHVSNTGRFRRPEGESDEQLCAFLLDELARTIEDADPSTICMVIMEPIQNVGGFLTAPAGYWAGVRELCDRHGILLVADETISGFGRVGEWFACERYGIRPDIVTCAKGLSSSRGSIGAVMATEAVWEPFTRPGRAFLHGISFGGAPLQCALALKNLEIMRREGLLERVRTYEDAFAAELRTLLDLPIVGDVRGDGYAWAVELVRDKATKETFSDAECDWLLRDFLSPQFIERGLITRSDDRDSPVIQFSPPLIAGPEEFAIISGVLREALTLAWERFQADVGA